VACLYFRSSATAKTGPSHSRGEETSATISARFRLRQQQVSGRFGADYRFAWPNVAELTSALATELNPAAGPC